MNRSLEQGADDASVHLQNRRGRAAARAATYLSPRFNPLHPQQNTHLSRVPTTPVSISRIGVGVQAGCRPAAAKSAAQMLQLLSAGVATPGHLGVVFQGLCRL